MFAYVSHHGSVDVWAAADLNIIASIHDGETVAAVSPCGKVAIFSIEGDDAMLVTSWIKNPKFTVEEMAANLLAKMDR